MSVSVEFPSGTEPGRALCVQAWFGHCSGIYVDLDGERFYLDGPVNRDASDDYRLDGSVLSAPGSMGMDKDRPLPRGTKIILTID